MKRQLPSNINPTDSHPTPNDPSQLTLFQDCITGKPNESRTLELFDAAPKFVQDKNSKTTLLQETLIRHFNFRDNRYTLEIVPATIKKGTKTVGVYPGIREEMVMRTIMYMAVQQTATLALKHDTAGQKNISATFSLWDIRKTLIQYGRTYSLTQIDEAIRVCRLASLNIRCETDKHIGEMSSGIFMACSTIDAKNDATGKESKRSVILHPLITKSLLENTSRRINFERLMSLDSFLSRWIYERMSHNFTQAQKHGAILNTGYHLSLQTIVRESGLTGTEQKHNIALIRKAIKELHKKGVLDLMRPFEETIHYKEQIRAKAGRRQIIDVVWTFFASSRVTEDIIAENKNRSLLR